MKAKRKWNLARGRKGGSNGENLRRNLIGVFVLLDDRIGPRIDAAAFSTPEASISDPLHHHMGENTEGWQVSKPSSRLRNP